MTYIFYKYGKYEDEQYFSEVFRMNIDRLNFWSGLFWGLGFVAFLDEMVFHQLLHWHHFYDKSTTSIGLISDGLFHAFSWFATVASLFMVADLRRKNAWNKKRWISAALIGAGGFNLYDGIIQHKIFKIHQIRYNVEIIYYDIVWNGLAAIILMIGILLLKQSKVRTGEI